MNVLPQDYGKADSISSDQPAGAAVLGPTSLPILPITIGPLQAVTHHGWNESREAALAACLSCPCVVIAAGAPGTGKTLLLQELARALEEAGAATSLHQRGDLWQDEWLSSEERATIRIILIDEADRMDPAQLARLAKEPGFGLVLARKHLPADEEADSFAEVFAGRRVTFVRLEPLLPGETGEFLNRRLVRAGHSGDMITAAAIAGLELYSGRVPRLVNTLASAATFLANREGAACVEAEHVAEAAALSGSSAFPEPEQPGSSEALLQPPEREPRSTSSTTVPPPLVPAAAEIAVIASKLPERPGVTPEPTPAMHQANASPVAALPRIPVRLNVGAEARVPMARCSSPEWQHASWFPFERARVRHWGASLVLGTFITSAATGGGWLVSHEAKVFSAPPASESAGVSPPSGVSLAAETRSVAASVPGETMPPSTHHVRPTPAVAERQPVQRHPAVDPERNTPSSTAAPALAPQALTSSGAKAAPQASNAEPPSSAQLPIVALAVPPLPPAVENRGAFWHADPLSTYRANATRSSYTMNGSLRPRQSRQAARGASKLALQQPSAPIVNVEPLQPAPRRYIGSYVMGPSGRRVFVGNP